MAHVFITIMIGSAKFPSWLLSKKVAAVGEAMKEFKQYMVEMVDRERAASTRGEAAGANLMSSLVRASEEQARRALHMRRRVRPTIRNACLAEGECAFSSYCKDFKSPAVRSSHRRALKLKRRDGASIRPERSPIRRRR